MTISKFDIIFSIKGSYYLGGTVSASHDHTELFFHFPWGGQKRANIQNINNQSIQVGCLPDHISFHSDGRVHSKGRVGHKKVHYRNKFEIGFNPFNLPRGHFLPIYLESISLSNEAAISFRLKRIDHRPERAHACWDLSELSHCSLLLISMCAQVDPQKLLLSHGFELLDTVGPSHILTNIFSAQNKDALPSGCLSGFDTRLLIVVVMQSSLMRPSNIPSAKNMESSLASTSVSMPSMKIIAEMKNLNQTC